MPNLSITHNVDTRHIWLPKMIQTHLGCVFVYLMWSYISLLIAEMYNKRQEA